MRAGPFSPAQTLKKMAAKKAYEVALILAAADKMTATINKAFSNANEKLTGFQKKSMVVTRSAANVAAASGATALALAAPIMGAVDQAIKFEDAMAGVGKVLNMKVASKELDAVGDKVQELSEYIARTPIQAAELYANLAQGGAAREELDLIARKAGEVGVAFDIEAGIAGERFIKLSNAMGITTAETIKVTDAINHLSDNTAAKASQMLDFFAAGGAGAAKAMNLTGVEAAALGSIFISMGKSGEESSTVIERMVKTLRNADKQAGKVSIAAGGGIAGILAMLEKGKSLKGAERFKFFKEFGEYGIEVEQLANNFGMLQKHLGLVANEQNFVNSVNKEFQNRMSTTATKLKVAQAQLQNIAIEAGTGLLPVIGDIIKAVSPLLKGVSEWVKMNPKLTSGIVKTIAVAAALAGAVSLVSSAVAAFGTVLTVASGPVGWIIAAVAAMAYGVYKVYQNWDKITAFFGRVWEGVKGVFSAWWNWQKSWALGMFDAGKNIVLMLWKGIKAMAAKPVEAMKAIVQKIRDFLPFSPAKIGPLADLHKIKLVETVAQSIKPAPMVSAMQNVAAATMQPLTAGISSAAQTSTSAINFSPTINITGSGAGAEVDILAALRQYKGELMRLFDEAQRNRMRVAY